MSSLMSVIKAIKDEAEIVETEYVIEEGHWEVTGEEVVHYMEYEETEGQYSEPGTSKEYSENSAQEYSEADTFNASYPKISQEEYEEMVELDGEYSSVDQVIIGDVDLTEEQEDEEDGEEEEDSEEEEGEEEDDETVGIFSDDHNYDPNPIHNQNNLTSSKILDNNWEQRKPVIVKFNKIKLDKINKSVAIPQKVVTARELFEDLVAADQAAPTVSDASTSSYAPDEAASLFPFRCTICCRSFASSKVFENHQEMHIKLMAVGKIKRSKKEKPAPVKKAPKPPKKIVKYISGLRVEGEDGVLYADGEDANVAELKVESTLRCYICNEEFTDILLLQEHCTLHGQNVLQKETSGKKLYFTCLVCEEVFSSAADRKEHEKTHEPDQCSLCGDYVCRRELQRHIANHSKPKRAKVTLPLTQCELCTRQVRNLEKHMLMHANEGVRYFKCHHCPEKFDGVKSRDRHEEGHGLKEGCTVCGVMLTYSVMRQHMSHRHNTKPRQECDICGREVVDMKSHRSNHRRKEAGIVHKKKPTTMEKYKERSHVCPYCMNRLATGRALKQHVMRVHNVGDEIFCRSCTCMFKTNEELAEHRLTCLQKKRASTRQCPVCAKVLPLIRFGAHVRFHAWHEISPTFTRAVANVMQPAACPRCPLILRSPYHLANHIVSHYALGWDFECSTCHKCFSTEVRLLHHKENGQCHIKMKVYPKKTKKSQELDDPEKPAKKKTVPNWACSECMEVFRSKVACQTHIAELH